MYICIHPVLSCIIFSKPVSHRNLRRNLPKMVYILNPRMKLGKNTVCSAFFLEVLEAIAMRNFSAFELHIMICHLRSLPAVGMGRIGKLSALLPVENGALPTCLVVSCCCVLKVSSALSTVCLPVACSADRSTVTGTCGMSLLLCFQDCCLVHHRSSRYRSLPLLSCHMLPICKKQEGAAPEVQRPKEVGFKSTRALQHVVLHDFLHSG